jgi:hypothetical protein
VIDSRRHLSSVAPFGGQLNGASTTHTDFDGKAGAPFHLADNSGQRISADSPFKGRGDGRNFDTTYHVDFVPQPVSSAAPVNPDLQASHVGLQGASAPLNSQTEHQAEFSNRGGSPSEPFVPPRHQLNDARLNGATTSHTDYVQWDANAPEKYHPSDSRTSGAPFQGMTENKREYPGWNAPVPYTRTPPAYSPNPASFAGATTHRADFAGASPPPSYENAVADSRRHLSSVSPVGGQLNGASTTHTDFDGRSGAPVLRADNSGQRISTDSPFRGNAAFRGDTTYHVDYVPQRASARMPANPDLQASHIQIGMWR